MINNLKLTETDSIESTVAKKTTVVNPFYDSPTSDFKLYKGDNVDILSKLPDLHVDMIFADPPYFLSGGGISCHNGKTVCVDKADWDKPLTIAEMDAFNFRWLNEVHKHMLDDGTIWISSSNHNFHSVYRQLLIVGFKFLNNVAWVKPNASPNVGRRQFKHSIEHLIWAAKSDKSKYYFDYNLMKQLNGGVQDTDVWRLATTAPYEKKCGNDHPTQKPLKVLTKLIQASSKPNALILDPFNGSGTTGIAANLLGRNYVGIDQECKYLELSKKRREEINDSSIRNDLFNRFVKDGVMLPTDVEKYKDLFNTKKI